MNYSEETLKAKDLLGAVVEASFSWPPVRYDTDINEIHLRLKDGRLVIVQDDHEGMMIQVKQP